MPAESITATGAERFRRSPFYAALAHALARRGLSAEGVCDLGDAVQRRLLAEYGALFLADMSVLVPRALVFRGEDEVRAFQSAAGPRSVVMSLASEGDDVIVELQAAAVEALLAAREEARTRGFDVTPRGGAEAARRSYADTVRLWQSRVEPALEHWRARGRLAAYQAERVRRLAPTEQIAAVLELEAAGVFFSKDFTKSILYSVAAPGASQHLALLAFDVAEFQSACVRSMLARHGWFQTVRSDLPHFTFLGVREKDLPGMGLARVEEHGQAFWFPDLG